MSALFVRVIRSWVNHHPTYTIPLSFPPVQKGRVERRKSRTESGGEGPRRPTQTERNGRGRAGRPCPPNARQNSVPYNGNVFHSPQNSFPYNGNMFCQQRRAFVAKTRWTGTFQTTYLTIKPSGVHHLTKPPSLSLIPLIPSVSFSLTQCDCVSRGGFVLRERKGGGRIVTQKACMKEVAA